MNRYAVMFGVMAALVGGLSCAILENGGGGGHQDMMSAPKGYAMAMSRLGYEDTVSELEKAIDAEALMRPHPTIDHNSMLAQIGFKPEMKMTTIEFFHPKYGKRIVEAMVPFAATNIPLRIVVMSGMKGVMIFWEKPGELLGRYGNSKMAELGRELDGVIERIVAKVKM